MRLQITVATVSQLTAAIGAPRAAGDAPKSDGSKIGVAALSTGALPPGTTDFPATTSAKRPPVMLTVVQCINSGIDKDASSTTSQQVICRCGFRIRKKI